MRRSLLSVALLCLSLATVLAGGAAAQEVSFSSGTYRANEGDALRPELVLSHARSEAVTVRVEALDLGEAKSGEDFAADPWNVTVPAGQKRQAFSIATVDDDKREGNEQFLLHIAPYGHSPGVRRSSDGNANADAVAVINDSDAGIPIPVVAFSSSTTRAREGVGTHDVKLNLSPAPSENITLRYGVYTRPFYSRGIPPATAGSDFEAQQYVELPVPKGATTAIIPVTIINDDVHEGDENFWLRLGSGAGYRRGKPPYYRGGYSHHLSLNYHNVVIIDDDPRIEASFASALQSVDEGAGARDVTVNLTPAPASDITLDYTVGGTATAGADYTALSGTLSVSADATTATIPVAIVDDSDREGDETVVLTLTGGGGHRIVSPDTHTLTIAGSDGPPTMTSVSFASASQSAGEESGTRNVAVNLTPAPESDITLSYTVGGTATAGSDYTALSGTLTVPAGATTATIPVALVADSDQEDRETVVLTLAGGTGYRVSDPDTHVLTIGTVPTVTIPRAGTFLYEGAGTHHVAVHLSPAPPSGITLYYTVTGTATSGLDYQPLSGTVSVPARAARVFIPVTIIDDSVEDSGEFIRLTLLDKPGYTVDRRYYGHSYGHSHRYWVYIFNHESGDLEGLVQARLDAAVAGGDSASANLWRRALAAVRGEAPPNGLAPLTEADAQALAVDHAGKGDIELASLWAEIAHVIGGGTTPPPPAEIEVAISAGASPVTEGGDAVFTVTADPAPASSLAVTVTVTAEGEYGVAVGERKVTIPATGSATLTLATTGDEVDEPDGSVTVTVAAGDGYTVGAPASDSVSIQDNDEPPPAEPAVTISAGASPVTEGGDAVFTVTADPAPASSLSVTVTVATDGDYGIVGGDHTVTIPATGSETLTLATTNDEADEPDGSVTATVKDGDGYTVGSSASGSVSIQDNDEPPPAEPSVTISAGASPVTEGGDAVFTVTADPAPAADLSVTVAVAVAAEGDYGIAAGERTVTVPAAGSATLTLTTTNDEADEPDGSVTVTVKDGEGYTVDSSASGTVAIADDDPTPTNTTDVDPALVAQVRGYAAETHEGQAHVDRWKRVLAAFGDDNGYTAMTAAEAQTYADRGWQRWVPVVDALEALEAVPETVTPPGTVPAVSVSAGADVTEGGDAMFTVTATPAPAAELAVSVDIAADGDYGITAGKQTVTIPTTGSATLTLATTNDDTDEPDGSVTVTLNDGDGYTVGAPASGSVSIQDDDEPPPVEPSVTIAAGASPVTEGGDATFTLTASPAPASPLAVSVTVALDGAYGITAGKQTVTLPTAGSATLTLATTSDDTDEPDGSVTVTVSAGEGYTVGDPASGSVAIADDDLPAPVMTVTASAAPVTEGGDALFTVRASRAPDADLAVALEVADAPGSDFVAGGDEGARAVTIPDGATSVVFTLATVNDEADEPDGGVTVTVKDGDGYTVGAPASDTLTIEDDDLPPPEVSIAAKAASVAEGGTAAFTLTADRAPAADLSVSLSVAETGGGDRVAAADEGPATAVIAKGKTEAVFSVATVDDDADEPDGSVTVTLKDGDGYTVAPSQGAATVTVSDNDAAAALPSLSVADVTITEGAWMEFPVRLSAPSAEAVSVKVSTRHSTPVSASARDYWPLSGRTVSFRAGETERSVGVIVFDDSHDEEPETFEVVLSDARGAAIGDGVAVGTIVNSDPMPAAWLARLGRTVAEQALDGIAGRIAAPRTPGMRGTLAGRALDLGAPAHDPAGPDHAPAGAPAFGGTGSVALSGAVRGFASPPGRLGTGGIGHDTAGVGDGFGEAQSHAMTVREALLGSSFTLTGETDASGGSMAFWGRAAQSRFDGREGTFSLDGEVTTGMLGADYARDEWLVGLALAQSTGEGGYRDTGAGSQSCPDAMDAAARALCAGAVRAGAGTVEASLAVALPYASLQASERLELWGALGYGAGEVTLKTALGGRYKADTDWRMAAAGLRGALLTPPAEGSGPALALTSDALWARTASEKTRHLAASRSDATRLRLGLEGSWRMALDGGAPGAESGASLTPKLEVGARHDGGDAETGFGIELGGGIAWVDPAFGLTLDLSGRTLLAHEDGDLEDRGYAAALGFDPRPASERGPSLSLRQELGARATGGLDALFAPAPLDERTGAEATGRWSLEAAYGFRAFGGRYTGSPHVGLGLSAAARDYSLGGRWTPEANAPDLAFGVKATRRESDTAAPEHTVGFEVRATW